MGGAGGQGQGPHAGGPVCRLAALLWARKLYKAFRSGQSVTMNQVGLKGLFKGGKFVLKTAEKVGEVKQQVKSGVHHVKNEVKQVVNKVEKAVKLKK